MDSIFDVTEVASDEEVLDIEPEVISLESDSDYLDLEIADLWLTKLSYI